MYILHCVKQRQWEADAAPYGQDSLDRCGFLHCSDLDTYVLVAPNFREDPEARLLLVIDCEKVTAPIRWEDSEGVAFPHIYGLLNRDAVAAVFPHLWDKDRVWLPNEGLRAFQTRGREAVAPLPKLTGPSKGSP